MIVDRPKFKTVKLADGLRWTGGGGWRYEEKMDGVWSTMAVNGSILIGEQMREGRFFTFDIACFQGQDVRGLALRDRLAILNTEFAGKLQRPAAGGGGEFLEAVLARGGEGVVAKLLEDSFNDGIWHRCKRVETFDLLVVDKITPSVRLKTLQGEDRGWCCARAVFDEMKIGDVVEVACFSLTAKGKLREPRFVRIRHDK